MNVDMILRLACQTSAWKEALDNQAANAASDPGFAHQYVEQAMIAACRVVLAAYK